MVSKGDFQKIIFDFFTIHHINEETTIEIKQWEKKREIFIYEVADILGSIPDSFLKIEIARDLTNALYATPEHFIEQLIHFSNLAYSSN